ncbi:hypothetical protein MBAV_005772, partial [Candidatus Magnetobacterium bavaricum]
YYDKARKSNITILLDADRNVVSIGFCFKDNPFPLSRIFSPEMNTFISMPDGFRPVPWQAPPGFEFMAPPTGQKGCSGCGGSQRQEMTQTTDENGHVVYKTHVYMDKADIIKKDGT